MVNSAQIIDTSTLLSINPELVEWIDEARTLSLSALTNLRFYKKKNSVKISPLYYDELVESIVRRGFFCEGGEINL